MPLIVEIDDLSVVLTDGRYADLAVVLDELGINPRAIPALRETHAVVNAHIASTFKESGRILQTMQQTAKILKGHQE